MLSSCTRMNTWATHHGLSLLHSRTGKVHLHLKPWRSVQGRNEVRWRPEQGASLAPPCSKLMSFGSKCTVLKKVLVTLLGFFGDPRSHSSIVPPLPPRYAPGSVVSLLWKHFNFSPSSVSNSFEKCCCSDFINSVLAIHEKHWSKTTSVINGNDWSSGTAQERGRLIVQVLHNTNAVPSSNHGRSPGRPCRDRQDWNYERFGAVSWYHGLRVQLLGADGLQIYREHLQRTVSDWSLGLLWRVQPNICRGFVCSCCAGAAM